MEIPTFEPSSEQELSLDEQVSLAVALLEAARERNDFTARQGGFDTFAEGGQHFPGMREAYDKLEAEFNTSRQAFADKVPDKAAVVAKLREVHGDEAADSIALMFRIRPPQPPRRSFSDFFKK